MRFEDVQWEKNIQADRTFAPVKVCLNSKLRTILDLYIIHEKTDKKPHASRRRQLNCEPNIQTISSMKKLIICGIASLFIGGIAHASVADLHTIALMEEIEIIDEGYDDGGHYYIIDNGRECRKVYPVVHTDTPGIVD
jgi:hypothetical protein